MGPHEYRQATLGDGHFPPLLILVILAGADTFVVCMATAPWLFQDVHSPRVLLAPIVNGVPIAVLLVVEIVLWNALTRLWNGLRSSAFRWEIEADAAFASISPSPHVGAIHEPVSDPAVVVIETEPGRSTRVPDFVLYADDQQVRTVIWRPGIHAALVREGRHQLFIKMGYFASQRVEVDLVSGEQVQLVCGFTPLVQSRFFRFFKLKMMFVAIPVAVAAFYFPPVMNFLEQHFAAEFLAVIFIAQLGFVIEFVRTLFSKPGTFAYLQLKPVPPER
jgi:hypothetical protein